MLQNPTRFILLIASGKIYVDLTAAAIAEPDRVRLFANAEIAEAYALAHHGSDNSEAIYGAAGGPHAETLNIHSEVFRLLAAASENDLAAANRRFDLVKRRLAGEEPTHSVPARTMRLWIAQYRLAKEQYGNGYVGLLPKTSKRGNRTQPPARRVEESAYPVCGERLRKPQAKDEGCLLGSAEAKVQRMWRRRAELRYVLCCHTRASSVRTNVKAARPTRRLYACSLPLRVGTDYAAPRGPPLRDRTHRSHAIGR